MATTAVTMQRGLSASWAEAPPRSPQGSLNAPSGVGQFAPVRLGREDARSADGVDVAWLLRTIRSVAPHNVEDGQRIEIARMQQLLAERD